MLEDGFPDIVCQRKNAVAFVETKARIGLPVRITSVMLGEKYGLRQSQKNWWLDYNLRGGKLGFIVTRAQQFTWTHSSAYADALNGMTFEEFCDTACARTIDESVRTILEAMIG